MRFVEVYVEEHEAVPEGCSMRFRAQTDGEPIDTVYWEAEDGREGRWRVVGRRSDGQDVPAVAFAVDGSSAGTSILVVGGDHGLRLTPLDAAQGTSAVAEPYLLVSRAAVVSG